MKLTSSHSTSKPPKSNLGAMKQISVDPDHYHEDIRPLIQPIIKKHGMEEWKAGVLTNEIHGHVGIYALIGMKMGVLAKEYFSANGDDMHIRSFAGRTPPVSCMNDGLQVSTGSSLGHGLITVENSNEQKVAAIIDFNGNKQRFSLKDDIAEKISNDIRIGIMNYGLSSDMYWEHIRKLALQYWLDLDRHQLFTITKAD